MYPDVRTFTILTDGLCKEGKIEDAEEVMKHMIEKGVEPNVITYNVIMDGYCLRGQLDRARRIFDILIDKGIEPNIFTYNILINGYCKKRNSPRPCNCFVKFLNRDQSLILLPPILSCKAWFEVGRIWCCKPIVC
uniref:Putative pentatricopeptide repeat-containing protein, chloroplastic-like n=1 Tax=Solanum chacoense TaxID=4108 RepID=A0A0V0H3Q1_SOLCH